MRNRLEWAVTGCILQTQKVLVCAGSSPRTAHSIFFHANALRPHSTTTMLSSVLVAFALLLRGTIALDNGLALTPPRAWTSWNLCRFEVNATLIMETAEALNATSLRLGWDTLQIDEGWEACAEYDTAKPYSYQTLCKTRTPRDAQGRSSRTIQSFQAGSNRLRTGCTSAGSS